MRTIAFSVGTIVATLLSGVGSSHADYYPWCAQYTMPGGASNCGFTTLAQCRAAVSGVGGYCIQNPWYLQQTGQLRRKQYPGW